MPAPAIKICGLTEPATLDAALAARAEFVGFNFYPPSPRYLAPPVAAEMGARVAGRARKVGVFVSADDAAIADAVAAAGLDAIQLHGGESPERVAQIRNRFGLPVWAVASIAGPQDLERAAGFAGAADFVLLDAKTPRGTLPGGMGLAFDWSLLSGWKAPLPWGLAGGLNRANVAEAIRLTGAPLVDVSSGVETAPGIKDAGLVADFCAAVRIA